MKKQVMAMLLAGGVGTRLNILARHRAKPALPFAGVFRIIDFTLSNIANSGIDAVGILTQYKPLSLMDHIDKGRPWDLYGRTRLVEILPPKTGEASSDWYRGTSDAVYQNLNFVAEVDPSWVLIVSGDHIYNMDYQPLLDFHRQSGAAATICLIPVPEEQTHHFGIAVLDGDKRIVDWEEKPRHPRSDLASMGVYVFDREALGYYLARAARSGGFDFAKDVIPAMLRQERVCGYRFDGYWRDVGTVDAYWEANMDVLNDRVDPSLSTWNVRTNLTAIGEVGDQPAAKVGSRASVVNAMISRGCVIQGTVRNSILSPGVVVERGAVVEDSVVFHDAVIQERATVARAIIDKKSVLGAGVIIGAGPATPNEKYPSHLSTGITLVGKGVTVPPGLRVGQNCILSSSDALAFTKARVVPSGSTI